VLVTFEEYTRRIDWSLTVGRRRTRRNRTGDDQARLIVSKVRGQHQITGIRSGLLGQAGTLLVWFTARGASPPLGKSMITS
jgi:hypothetical protein